MQFKNIAAVAFAASAFASPALEERQASSSSLNIASVYSVLQTAVPASIVSLDLGGNSAAASSAIVSEFAGGQTPSWFSGLPTDIQTYLVPVSTGAAAVTSAESSLSAASSLIASANSSLVAASGNLTSTIAANSTASSTGSGRNSTALTTSSSGSGSSTLGTTSGPSSSAAASSAAGSSSSSSAGAAVPTAVIGGGLAGALGLIGVLAL